MARLQLRYMLAGAFALALLGVAGVAHAEGGPAPSAAAAAHVKLPDGPGSVAGLGDDAEVGLFTGQVSYGVPFDLPAGPGGFGPSLGLAYSGELGNGPVGIGWTLSSAAIRRSTRQGIPSFTDADELELVGLGGGRLIELARGSSYRVEGKGNALKVERDGRRWLATDSDGTRYYFGLSAEARLEDEAGRIAEWRLELVVHRSGQTIEYRYLRDRGALYLADLEWGPEETWGRAFAVNLRYAARPDPVVSYRQGLRVETGRRLAAALVQARNPRNGVREELRAYHLAYDSELGLSRLAQVTMTGYLGRGSLPALSFAYGGRQPARVSELAGAEGWYLGSRGVALYDVDGDGMDDLVRLEMGNHQYRKNLGGELGPALPLVGASALELGQTAFVDLDGDARAELVRLVDDTWRASRMKDGQWEAIGLVAGTRNLPLAGPRSALADVNGDGRTDVLQAAASGLLVTLATAAGMGETAFLPRIADGDSWLEPGQPNVRFADVNGDGLVDCVGLTDAWMKILLGRGDGTFAPWRRTFYPWGDGAFDLANLHLADLNRDGLMDLVLVTAGHILYYRGLADGSVMSLPSQVTRPEESSADVTVAIADANGNGSQDVIWSSPRGLWLLDLAGATSAGMLTRIENGLGKSVTITYRGSAELAVESERAGEPWTHKLPASVPVPVRVDIDPGAGTPVRTVHYGVRDGFWDGSERRFGGFLVGRQSVVGETAADVHFTETWFHAGVGEERVLRGQPWHVRIESGLGKLHTVARTEWRTQWIEDLEAGDRRDLTAADPAEQPLLAAGVAVETRTAHYDGVPERLPAPIETLSWTTYDRQGRPERQHQDGKVGDAPEARGDEAETVTHYADQVDAWLLGRTCRELVLDEAGDPITENRTYYGGVAGDTVEHLCEVGPVGLVRKVTGYLAPVDARGQPVDGAVGREVTLSEVREYTSWHQPVVVYADGVWRRLGYDSRGLYLENEIVFPRGAFDGPDRLTWVMGWDATRGLPLFVFDPSDAATAMTYDDLGRVESVATSGSAYAHTRYQYDWRGPMPTTMTWVYDGPVEELGPWPGTWSAAARWRQSVAVANGAGEALYTATRSGPAQWIVSGWHELDHKGRVVYAADAFYYAGDDPRAAQPPLGTNGPRMAYDGYDRMVEQVLPNGVRKAIAYWAFGQEVASDELAPVTSYADGLGRVLRTERTIDGVTESVNATYSRLGQLTAMTLQQAQPQQVTHEYRYDSLGRMVFATDPDIGDRFLTYDDPGRLVRHQNGAGQAITYAYDGIGRLAETVGDDGTAFRYHYDQARPDTGESYRYTRGRLAWVEEPTGAVDVGYDSFGRQEVVRRSVAVEGESAAVSASETSRYSAAGQLLSVSYGHGLTVQVGYDDAGRAVRVAEEDRELWRLDRQDAAGRILDEHFGNGVRQSYERDVIGQPERILIQRPVGHARYAQPAYDVDVAHNLFGAITRVVDRDGSGIDHSSTFRYDRAGRLVDANVGCRWGQYRFGYEYDGLQNLVRRTADGPRELAGFAGEYRYGGTRPAPAGGSYGPRQVTAIHALDDGAGGAGAGGAGGAGEPIATFDYDAAGRQVRHGERTMRYNGLDQLVEVSGLELPDGTAASVRHGYGYDGLRVYTRGTDGQVTYWLTQNITEKAGVRQHYLKLGDRILARLTFDRAGADTGAAAASVAAARGRGLAEAVRVAILAVGLLFVLVVAARTRRWCLRPHVLARSRPAWQPLIASLAIVALVGGGCALLGTQRAVAGASRIVYFHHGIGAGPILMTDEAGTVVEDRAYEPFGIPLGAYRETETGAEELGPIDHAAEPHNLLNKPVDPDTEWSYHGARWMAPQTAMWLTPDPPVKAPDPKFMAAPWAMHPYQYVMQNPVMFWDPDGRDRSVREDTVDTKPAAVGQALPARLPKYVGTVDYYRERAKDFELRHRGRPAPDYYMDYGDKYVRKFTALKEKLSPAGQKWVGDVLVGLQREFELAVEDNPGAFARLEDDAAALRSFAFETHSRIYVDSGLGNLPLSDAFRIMFTVDAEELLSLETGAQVLETMARLVKAYPQQHRLIDEAANTVPRAVESVPERVRELDPRPRGIGGIDDRLQLDRTGGIDGSMRW